MYTNTLTHSCQYLDKPNSIQASVYIYIYIYVCVCVRIFVCMFVCLYVRMYVLNIIHVMYCNVA